MGLALPSPFRKASSSLSPMRREKRYATTESKLKNLKNTALLFGQQIGDDLNPTIRSLIDGAEELLQKFLSMDEAQRCGAGRFSWLRQHAHRL